jgi:hypothetical protein
LARDFHLTPGHRPDQGDDSSAYVATERLRHLIR